MRLGLNLGAPRRLGGGFLSAPGENIRKAAILLEALQRQAGSFADAFGKVLPQDDRETVQELATLRAHRHSSDAKPSCRGAAHTLNRCSGGSRCYA